MRQGACTPAQNIRAPAPESPEKISPYIRLARAFNHGLVQLQDKIAAHFAHAIYPYSFCGGGKYPQAFTLPWSVEHSE